MTMPPVLRRVVVALDADEPSATALESAARLAAEAGAELVGLFVEDAELLVAAALPFSRLVAGHGRSVSGFELAALERALRVRSLASRRALEGAAARWRVRTSFQVTRGGLGERLLAAVEEPDLLTFGAVGRALARSRAPSARDIARRSAGAVWLMRLEGARPLVLLYEGSDHALAVAAALARVHGGRLRVLATAPAADVARRSAETAAGWLAAHAGGRPPEVVAVSAGDAAAALRGLHPRLLVVERHGATATALDPLLDELGCSLVVVG